MSGYEKSPDYGSKPPTPAFYIVVFGILAFIGIAAYYNSTPAPIYIVDADTFDIGETRYRIIGFDAPEKRMKGASSYGALCPEEKVLGLEATAYAVQLTDEHRPKIVKTYGPDNRGRTLADVEINGRDWKAVFIEKGIGAAWNYDAGDPKPDWCNLK